MPVIRVEKKSNFTVMSNKHLKDTRLSLKAVGLLSKMLSLSADWKYSIRGLAAISKEGVDGVRAALNELERYGYLERYHRRGPNGQIQVVEYRIYERPSAKYCGKNCGDPGGKTGIPDTAAPCTEKPYTGLAYLEKPTE